MIKAIFKTVGLAAALILTPILLIVAGIAFLFVGPLAGVLVLIFLPMVLAGVIIGYNEAKKDKRDE